MVYPYFLLWWWKEIKERSKENIQGKERSRYVKGACTIPDDGRKAETCLNFQRIAYLYTDCVDERKLINKGAHTLLLLLLLLFSELRLSALSWYHYTHQQY
jgi:hypothetical protein